MEQYRKFVKELVRLHALFVLISGAGLITAYVLRLNNFIPIMDSDSGVAKYSELVAPLLVGLAIAVVSVLIYNRLLTKSKNEENETERFNLYKRAQIIKWSGYVDAALIAVVFYILFGANNFILYAVISIVFLIYVRPLSSRMEEDLMK
jgi:predicted histidine transporter YuiF (NhaC family)